MNRRGFLGLLAAAATLDPERLLWRPGAKVISVPPRVHVPKWQIIPMEVLYRGGRTTPDGYHWYIDANLGILRVSFFPDPPRKGQ